MGDIILAAACFILGIFLGHNWKLKDRINLIKRATQAHNEAHKVMHQWSAAAATLYAVGQMATKALTVARNTPYRSSDNPLADDLERIRARAIEGIEATKVICFPTEEEAIGHLRHGDIKGALVSRNEVGEHTCWQIIYDVDVEPTDCLKCAHVQRWKQTNECRIGNPAWPDPRCPSFTPRDDDECDDPNCPSHRDRKYYVS